MVLDETPCQTSLRRLGACERGRSKSRHAAKSFAHGGPIDWFQLLVSERPEHVSAATDTHTAENKPVSPPVWTHETHMGSRRAAKSIGVT